MTTAGPSTEGIARDIGKLGRIIVDLQVAVTVAAAGIILEPLRCAPIVDRRGVITDGMTIATREGQVCCTCVRALAPGRDISVNSTRVPGVRSRRTVAAVTFIDIGSTNREIGISGPLIGPIDIGRMAGSCTGTGGVPQDCRSIRTTLGIDRNHRTTLDRVAVNMTARWRSGVTAFTVGRRTVKIMIMAFARYRRRRNAVVQTRDLEVACVTDISAAGTVMAIGTGQSSRVGPVAASGNRNVTIVGTAWG